MGGWGEGAHKKHVLGLFFSNRTTIFFLIMILQPQGNPAFKTPLLKPTTSLKRTIVANKHACNFRKNFPKLKKSLG
jgi:hypothetical protein